METGTVLTRVPDGHPDGEGGKFAIAGGKDLVVGEVYRIRHTRKGTFEMKVTDISPPWVGGVIVEGVADAVMSYNVKSEGDSIAVRSSQAYFVALTQARAGGNAS